MKMVNEQSLKISPKILHEKIKIFLSAFLKERSQETIDTYEKALREFSRYFLRSKKWFRFRQEDITKYKKYLTSYRNLSEVSVSTYLTALRRLMDYFVSEDLLPTNFARNVKGNRRPQAHTIRPLEENEITMLLSLIPTTTNLDLRDRILIRLMSECGASEHELVKANIEDFKHTSTHSILHLQPKGKKAKVDTISISLDLAKEIKIYIANQHEGLKVSKQTPLFLNHSNRGAGTRITTRSIRYRVTYWLEKAGIVREGISPNSLRHTAAYLWLTKDKLSLEEVKKRMRLSSIVTAQYYYS